MKFYFKPFLRFFSNNDAKETPRNAGFAALYRLFVAYLMIPSESIMASNSVMPSGMVVSVAI